MDRRRTHAEGGGGGGGGGGGVGGGGIGIGRVVHRRNLTSTLTVVVLLQNLLVAACLVGTLYVYWKVYQVPEGNIYIEFVLSDISGNKTLEYNIISYNKMDLIGNDKISIKCTGPYVLYMYGCYGSLHDQEDSGILQLQVESVPVASVMMNTSNKVCRGLHSIAYLKEKDQTSLWLYSTEGFKIKNMTVGLSYLLGTQCEY